MYVCINNLLLIHQDDIALYEAFRAGLPEAANAIFTAHFRSLCFFSERITGNLSEAEDIVADAFIKLLQRREQFQNLENIKAFLYVTARNACINYVKSVQRHQAAHARLRYLMEDGTEQEDMLQQEMIRMEVLGAIHQEIERLPVKCRNIFKLIFIHGCSTDQAASQLGIAPQTVRSQKSRAIRLLRSRLFKKGELVVLFYLLPVLACHI